MPSRAQDTRAVAVEVRFQLTDLDYRPLAGQRARVGLGSASGWQAAGAGQAFHTGPTGEGRFVTNAVLEKRMRKRPTSFVQSLEQEPEPVDHLQVAAELEYLGHPRLYTFSLHRFGNGDVLMDSFAVYTADARGDFTVPARHVDGGWEMADLSGLRLTSAGHDAWKATIEPEESDPSSQRWILELAFKRHPEPVRR